ncbi:MAG: cysteine peptidase family C39 domain-containing protein [Pseudomonadota bacterium]
MNKISASLLAAALLWLPPLQAGQPVKTLLEMRQSNVVMQEWDLSCGAATLATVLRYQHGMDISEKEIAAELISRPEYVNNPELLQIKQGFSLLDLKRFVDRRGLIGDGFGGLDLDDIIDMAPVILPVSIGGYSHFVVFRGMVNNRVLLADPAWGNRVLTVDNFEDVWLEIGNLGKVGFTVSSSQNTNDLNRLAPTAMDFVMLN